MWIVAYGNFILSILGLRFDQIFVGAFLNMEFVVGHRHADGIIGRFGQQVYEQPVSGVQVFPFFQNRQAIFQHILDIERPERGRNEHPFIKPAQRFNHPIVQLSDGRMVTLECFPGPLRPVKGAGLEFFKVEIEGFGHGFSVAASISRHLNESKC